MRRVFKFWWIGCLTSVVALGLIATTGSVRCLTITKALGNLDVIRTALDNHRHFRGTLPTTEDGLAALVPEFMARNSRDPWGNHYVYRRSAGSYVLYSTGIDGLDQNGDGDDVSTPGREAYCDSYGINCRPDWDVVGVFALLSLLVSSALVGLARGILGIHRLVVRDKLH